MTRLLRILALAAVVLVCAATAGAQRRITPVKSNDAGKTAPPVDLKKAIDPSRLVTTTDAQGNSVTVDTVTGREYVDSSLLAAPPKMIYPLLHQVIAGVNVWDGAMRLLGQKYGIGDVWAELGLHNRYFPYVAWGLGQINDRPLDKNYTFRVGAAPYFKIGASYNLFYNSSPDYKLQLGMRYGITHARWSVLDAVIDEGYWQEPSTWSVEGVGFTAGYLEITAGLKVKIAGPVSAGWTLVYHAVLHESKSPYGKTMYIPGYGKRGGAFTANLSLMYTLNLHRAVKEPVNFPAAPGVDNGEDTLPPPPDPFAGAENPSPLIIPITDND